jgi:pimeloyl-ACP methyl ester carboxylesterase
MQKAGIGPDSKVLFVGHSQGGIIAANISTRYAGSKVLSFGSPLGQLGSQLKAETIAVEHVADLVPMLDGKPNPASANLVTVRQEIQGAWPGEQHEMAGYRKTAEAIDQAPADSQPNSGFARIRREISDFAGTSQGQALYFELERVSK